MLIPSNSHEGYHGESANDIAHFVQATLDALSSHIAILDEQGTIIAVNQAWRLFGDQNDLADPQYGIGQNYLDLCDAASHNQHARQVAKGIRDIINTYTEQFSLEYPCHSPYEKRWFMVRISGYEWLGYQRIIVSHQNITELKQVQIELAKSNERLKAVVENINNSILTLNAYGFIKTANQATARIFGYDIADIIDKHLDQLIVETLESPDDLQNLIHDCAYETIGIRQDATHFPVSLSLNKFTLDDNTVYTCIIQDISSSRRVEAEILEREHVERALQRERELRTLKNRFLSMMGHELNTPLTSITLSYDMLKKYGAVSTPEENEQALDNIQQQVTYLRDMVKDVITLSRSEAGSLSMNAEKRDLVTYCRDIVEEFDFVHSRTHTIDFSSDQLSIFTQFDTRSLRRVFTNLLSNAIKYSPDGSLIRMTMTLDDSNEIITVQVSDAGMGIPPEDHAQLFEPFHRATNVNQLPGTGLGLAIVKQAVEAHGGTIVFESKLGEGSTFTIQLPFIP